MKRLPIDEHVDRIRELVRANPITIVEAPPGSGKTTRVAPALLKDLAQGERIYLLQPRRLAARSVAERIASEQSSAMGGRIGYQVRFDNKVSKDTQLVVATEGILVRRLQNDPAIADTAIILLDEFHERSMDADLLLGMLRRVQQTLRDDLRIVIMSATIDAEQMRTKLNDAPIVHVDAAMFPVAIRYRPPKPQQRIAEHMAETIGSIAGQHEGDILGFLPGAGEIHRCRDILVDNRLDREFDILPLYGSMPLDEQSRAIQTGSRRRIVLATNVAETSLTIEGVRVVVDSGLARVMRFSPDVGLDRLVLENISGASATQRSGRAGRVAPGTCYRLWSEASDRSRPAYLEPEIRRVDIVGAMLQLYAWGEGDSPDFPWLEPPRDDAVAGARLLLERLDAIAANTTSSSQSQPSYRITDLGKIMASLPLHPRLARLTIEAYHNGCLDRIALLAAMLSEREPFDRREQRPGSGRGGMATGSAKRWDSDCLERVLAIERYLQRGDQQSPFGAIQGGAIRTITSSAEQIREQTIGALRDGTSGPRKSAESESILRTLLAGFPDRLAKRRATGKSNGLMVGGKGVQLSPQSGVTEAELFLCIEIEAGSGDALVRQASRVDADWLPRAHLDEREEQFFHPSQKQVVARRRTYWLDLILNETPTAITDEEACEEVLWGAVKTQWQQAFPVDDETITGYLGRLACLRVWLPDLNLPEANDAFLHEVARDVCRGKRSLAEVKAGAWIDWIKSRLSSEQQLAIEREAPAKIDVPSGSSIRIQYELGKPPVLAVKIQEVFSWKETPRIARGTVPLLLHLLSPSMRPQQVTNDLASFWKTGYNEVKKELKRRYPKHSWPDDPTTASAVRK